MLIIIEPTGFAGRYYSEFSIIIAAVIFNNTVFYLKIKFRGFILAGATARQINAAK